MAISGWSVAARFFPFSPLFYEFFTRAKFLGAVGIPVECGRSCRSYFGDSRMTTFDFVPIEIVIEPLSAQAFKPFGEVTDLLSGERRNHVTGAYDRTVEAIEPRLWVSTVLNAVKLPLSLQSLERHPYSAQSFMPVNGCPYIVVVCNADGSGQPDLNTLRGFIAAPGQGVTYARNVWHHGLSVLQAPAQFVVSMSFSGEGGDDIFLPLGVPVQLVSKDKQYG